MAAKKPTSPPAFTKKQLQRTGIIILAGVLGLLTGALILLFLSKSAATPLITPAVVNQPVTSPAVTMTVLARQDVPAREFMSGATIDGKKGLIITLRVTNTTKEPQQFLPVNQVFIKGVGSTIYQMIPVAGVKNPITAGEVASGATLEGDISFMIDADDTDLRLYVDTRWANTTPSVIRL